mgnify:CR=1 FL=1
MNHLWRNETYKKWMKYEPWYSKTIKELLGNKIKRIRVPKSRVKELQCEKARIMRMPKAKVVSMTKEQGSENARRARRVLMWKNNKRENAKTMKN